MTRSDDRTLRPSATAVSRVLTVLRPLCTTCLCTACLGTARLGTACPRTACPVHVPGSFCRTSAGRAGGRRPGRSAFHGTNRRWIMSCEHHHVAGEAPAAAFDSNLRIAHQRHSLAKARGPPNRQARGIRSALTRSSSAWRRLCCRPCRRPSLTPCDRGSRGPDPCWCVGAEGESADGFALPFRRPLKAISSPPRPRQSDAHRGPAMNTVGGESRTSITDRQVGANARHRFDHGFHPGTA